jgi:hypothetical protein
VTGGTRHHGEAFPQLDVRSARKHVLRARHVVLWRDQYSTVVGQGYATIEEDILRLHTQMRAFNGYPVWVADNAFQCEVVKNAEDAVDCFTNCPDCDQRKRKLYLVDGEWLCRACHQLGYASSMMGERARKSARLAALDKEVARGRPKGMHEATFQRKREERAGLLAELGDARLTPSTAYSDVVTALWLEGPPIVLDQGRIFSGELAPGYG